MKRIISLVAALAFSLTMVGCHASVDAEGADGDTSSSHYKKTTTYDNGGTKTTTEKKTTTVNP